MLQKLKSKGFLCFVVVLCLGLVFLLLMYQMGFRITYAPDLENSWNAISGTASWMSVIVSVLGVIASFGAVWYAIQISDKQNKIALFEKRYRVYRTLISCDFFQLVFLYQKNQKVSKSFFIHLFMMLQKNQRRTSISFLHLNIYKLPKLWLKANFCFQEIFGKMYIK